MQIRWVKAALQKPKKSFPGFVIQKVAWITTNRWEIDNLRWTLNASNGNWVSEDWIEWRGRNFLEFYWGQQNENYHSPSK